MHTDLNERSRLDLESVMLWCALPVLLLCMLLFWRLGLKRGTKLSSLQSPSAHQQRLSSSQEDDLYLQMLIQQQLWQIIHN